MELDTFIEIAKGVGQAVVGLGIAGAVIAYFLRIYENRTQSQRERDGLLRMLLVEIEENQRVLRGFKARPAFAVNAPSGYLRWGVWEDVRTRLAQLLEDEEKLSDLARCYDMIQQIEAFRHIDRSRIDEQDIVPEIDSKLPTALERCKKATQYIHEYLPEATGAYLPPSEK